MLRGARHPNDRLSRPRPRLEKPTNEKLNLGEEPFRLLVSGVKDYGIFMMDPQGNILNWNEGAERIEGYKAEEVVGKNFSIFYTERDKRRGHPQHELEIAEEVGKYEEEGLRVRKDGSVFFAHVLITALRDSSGNLRGFGKVTRDITEKKRAEEALRKAHADLERRVAVTRETMREQEAKIRLIANALPSLVAYIQPDRRYAYNNDAYQRWFGRPVSFFTGKTLAQSMGEKAYRTIRPHLEKALAGQAVVFESCVEYCIGPSRYVHASYVPDWDGDRVRGVVALVEDITERNRQEAERKRIADSLRQANAELKASNDELSQFAHIASHDLKEPLRMVKVYSQLAESRYRNRFDDTGREYLSFLVEGATRMDELINDLLAYSAVGKGESILGKVSLSRVVAKAIANLRGTIQETRAEIKVGRLPSVQGNESQLTQLFQNLIGNALKFQRGGHPKVRIRAETKNREWWIRVEDNGIGIESQYLEKIFVMFQRLHDRSDYPGTGIGLAICRRIVERHGGKIWATSEPGKGSTFWLTLPKEAPP